MGVMVGKRSEGIVVRAPHVVAIPHSSRTYSPLEVATVWVRTALRSAHPDAAARSPLRTHGGEEI